MAVTKIHGIKTTVDKAIEYICNPDKTDQNLYISSFACSPETAVLDFKYTLDHTHDCRDPHNTNKAFHLIQAFSPGEVSYEEAHQIGKELADRLLEGKYSYVLTTHTDKGHVHNHLIFCSADNITFSHYHDCKKNYWKIRNLSDTLCQEHNLSTIMPNGKKGMKYNEWAANKSESSKKAQLRKAGVCLEGAIIALACIIFSVFASSPPAIGDTSLSAVTIVWNYVGELVFNLLVLVGAVKASDRIVKEIMGL